ncbi:MAG TPA: hypothetical protein ENN21_08890 [Spirochaetes bacterium]|nr:hypothetical protein [Spirochaetota bacterium]
MTDHLTLQRFSLGEYVLVFDLDRSILTCRARGEGQKKIWGKKLKDVHYVERVLEDAEKYYVACENGEHTGLFLALHRDTGATAWFIPGKSFLQIIYGGYLYLIFIDDREDYFLLKVDREDGRALWHHRVEDDLYEYCFNDGVITLKFGSGLTKSLDLGTGRARVSP